MSLFGMASSIISASSYVASTLSRVKLAVAVVPLVGEGVMCEMLRGCAGSGQSR